MNYTNVHQTRRGYVLFALLLVGVVSTPPAIAQIAPDRTLGDESSRVTRNARVRGVSGDRIDGGAIRGSNLFHSFSEFNVNEGQRVYFANPSGIANILSRVTGNDVSDIMGTLGVDGGANLFLLNPNGIIFGPNARLDINGSFFASSADSIAFPDGSQFSASNPGDSGLLSVNVPLGVQYGSGRLGSLVQNEGVLAVNPGQSLTLLGETVLNSGGLIAPGGTIQILGDYVRLLDSATLDVSSATGGGTIFIGGGFGGEGTALNAQETFVGPDVIIRANGIGNADGGQVAIWSDRNTDFQGTVTAQAGILGGNGGFVETSSEEILRVTGTVDASAVNGNAGTWLIDPTNIRIVANGGGAVGGSIVNAGNISTALDEGTSVEITTNIGGTEEGNIIQEPGADIVWTSGSNLTLNADNDITLNADIRATISSDINDFPVVTITAPTGSVFLNNATINTSNTGTGFAGDIIINARDEVVLNNSTIESEGYFGRIFIGQSEWNHQNYSPRSVSLNRSTLSTTNRGIISVEDALNAGDISVSAVESISLINESLLQTQTERRGNAGNVTVNAGTPGNAGNITIGAHMGTPGTSLDGTQILARSSTGGIGNAGRITITATDTVTISGGGNPTVATDVGGGTGNGNDLTITARLINIANNTIVAASILSGRGANRAPAQAGNIEITATERISISDNSVVFSEVVDTPFGNGGRISVTAPIISLNGSSVNTQIRRGGRGEAGDIFITATQLLQVQNGGEISTITSGQGDAGNITISSSQNVIFEGRGANRWSFADPANPDNSDSSGAFASVEPGAVGSAGGIRITTGSLTLTDGAEVSARTEGQGTAGNINITADTLEANLGSRILTDTTTRFNAGDIDVNSSDALILRGVGTGLLAQTEGAGDAGIVSISTPRITLRDGAIVSALTTDRGQGGGISLQPHAGGRSLTVNVDENSRITAETNGSGGGGNVQVTVPGFVTLTGGGQLTVETIGTTQEAGEAGELSIVTGRLLVNDGTRVSAGTTGTGVGGDLTVTAGQVTVEDGASISASATTGQAGDLEVNAEDFIEITGEGSRLAVEATGAGTGGDLTVNARQVTVEDGASISASAITGRAGSLTVNAEDSVEIRGANSRLAVEATGVGGQAGSLTIETDDLMIRDGAEATVSSTEGVAGNLNITAGSVELNNGNIRAIAGSGEGGNIAINMSGRLFRMYDGSLISAQARNQASGGNVTLNVREGFVLASPFENSDIRADAPEGDGGRIEINTFAIFGLEERDSDTPFSDIDASGGFNGQDGQVILNTLNVDPTRGLGELPVEIVDASSLVAEGCIGSNRRDVERQGEFTRTGRGGLSSDPTGVITDTAPIDQLATLDAPESGSAASTPPDTASESLVEAQGLGLDENGKVSLVSDPALSTSVPASSIPVSVSCEAAL
jgi:filamentous hemagglutinin family protein